MQLDKFKYIEHPYQMKKQKLKSATFVQDLVLSVSLEVLVYLIVQWVNIMMLQGVIPVSSLAILAMVLLLLIAFHVLQMKLIQQPKITFMLTLDAQLVVISLCSFRLLI